MRYYLILIAIVLFISGCASSISSLEGVDKSLPQVKNIKIIPDVSSIAFEWDYINDDNVLGYAVYREGSSGFKEIAHIKNPHSTHFVDEDLVPETQYRYYFYTLGHTHYSQRSEIITTKTSFIDPVESVYASNDYPNQVKLIFSPHPNPSISHYLIQREIDGEFKTIAIVNHRLFVEYFDKDLKDSTSYRYRIVAVDFNDNPSRPSKIVTARTKNKPNISLNLAATDNLAKKIVVSWKAQNDIKQYKLYRSQTSNGKYSLIATTTSTEYNDMINESSKSYFYKISGVDFSNLESNLSESVKGSTRNAPAAPIIKRGYVDNNEAKIEWEANSDVKYFMLHRKNANTGEKHRFKLKENSFSDKEVGNGGEYSYYVVAIDEAGLESEPSNEIKLSIK